MAEGSVGLTDLGPPTPGPKPERVDPDRADSAEPMEVSVQLERLVGPSTSSIRKLWS